MGEPARIHNEAVGRVIQELWRLADRSPSHLNVMLESLLLGAAMLNFPGDPRRQAQVIQEIADAAQDRVVRP